MKGFSTRTFPDLPYKHLRPLGTADGALRGRYRHGCYQYIVGYGFWWIFMRSFAVGLRFRPRGLSGLAFFAGYASGLAGRTKRVDDDEFLAYMRFELQARARQGVRRRLYTLLGRRGSHDQANR
jgi:hypothetical protein